MKAIRTVTLVLRLYVIVIASCVPTIDDSATTQIEHSVDGMDFEHNRKAAH